MRLALATLLVLLPATAAAQAPFDLDALRTKWPGANAVLLERHLLFSMPDPDTLRVRTEHRLAILDDAVQEDLVLFTASRRPGCRDPHDISIHVVDPRGQALPWDGEVLELVAGDHPVDGERSSVTLSASRRGLSAGALLEESWIVDYDADCFGGFLGTERTFVEGDWPAEHVLVEVPCAGAGCFVTSDLPDALEFTPRPGGGLMAEARDVPAAPAEFSAAPQRRPVVIVGSADDPFTVAELLGGALDEQIERAKSVVDSHKAAAEAAWGHVRPRSVRYARYLDQSVKRLPEGQAFWQFGFDWGGPVMAGRRPLLALEWWALALAMLEPHGGIPILIDSETHHDPAPIGRVVNYDAIGVLLPGRGVLTDNAWFALSPVGELESNALLAGMLLLHLDGEHRFDRFPTAAGLERRTWTGTARPSTKDKLLVDATRTYRGDKGARLRLAWSDAQASGEDEDLGDLAKTFGTEWLFGHTIGRAEIDTDGGDPSWFSLQTTWSRPGLVQRGDGIVAVALPIQVHLDLRRLVLGAQPRASDYAVSIADDTVELEVQAPAGHRLVGLPAPARIGAGPVSLDVRWSRAGRGAKLEYRFTNGARIVSAEHGPMLAEIGEELRRLLRTRLLFAPE